MIASFLFEAVELVPQLHRQDFILDFHFAVTDDFNVVDSRKRFFQIEWPRLVDHVQPWHNHLLWFQQNKVLTELELKVVCSIRNVEIILKISLNFFPVKLKATAITATTHDAQHNKGRVNVNVEQNAHSKEDIEEDNQEVPLIESAKQFSVLV